MKKNDYNHLMKIYNSIINDLIEIDKKIDVLNRKISKNENKQKMILILIDDEFTNYFKENLIRQRKEVSCFIYLFFGLKMASEELLPVKIYLMKENAVYKYRIAEFAKNLSRIKQFPIP